MQAGPRPPPLAGRSPSCFSPPCLVPPPHSVFAPLLLLPSAAFWPPQKPSLPGWIRSGSHESTLENIPSKHEMGQYNSQRP